MLCRQRWALQLSYALLLLRSGGSLAFLLGVAQVGLSCPCSSWSSPGRVSIACPRASDEAQYYGSESGQDQESRAQRRSRPTTPPKRPPIRGPYQQKSGERGERERGAGDRTGGEGEIWRHARRPNDRRPSDNARESGDAWRQAVDLDEMDRTGRRRTHGGGPPRGRNDRGGNRGPPKMSWWTDKMEGELELPLPWWANPQEIKYETMKVAELRAELQRRDAKTAGTKKELVDRLEELDRRYTLTDDGFVQAPIREPHEDPDFQLPSCYPEVYGSDLEKGLWEEAQNCVHVQVEDREPSSETAPRQKGRE